MKLVKKSASPLHPAAPGSQATPEPVTGLAVNRREFPRQSGLMTGGAIPAAGVARGMIHRVHAADPAPAAPGDTVRNRSETSGAVLDGGRASVPSGRRDSRSQTAQLFLTWP